jgi:tripartite-type tricarboxylate transporter receptor subunit TctC
LDHISHRRRTALKAILGVTVVSATATAQASANRSIRVITLEAGSQTDTIARAFLPALESHLGQDLFVENHGGAGGRIAARMVAQASDGHTIGIGGANNLVLAALLGKEIGYDPARDFAYVAALARVPFAIAVRSELAVSNVAELLDRARRAERELTFGSAGVGGSSHLAIAALAHARSLSLLHIPFRGSNLATHEVAAGRVDMVATDLARLLPLAEAKKIRIIAVTGSARDPRVPEIATLSEQGLSGLYLDPWYGLYGPRGMPVELRERLTRAAAACSTDRGVLERTKAAGIALLPPTRQALESLILADTSRYKPLIAALRTQLVD